MNAVPCHFQITKQTLVHCAENFRHLIYIMPAKFNISLLSQEGANLKVRQGKGYLFGGGGGGGGGNLIVYGTPDCTSAYELKLSETFRFPEPSPPVKFPYSPIHNLLCRHVSTLFISSICVKLLHR